MAEPNTWTVPHGQSEITGSDSETVALRHHLEALILKLASAQAGSLDAVRESRRHAEAALELLDRSEEVLCEHARVFGVGQTDDEWLCEGCGASWPKGTAACTPAPVRTHRKVPDRVPVPTMADPDRVGEPVNSL